MLGNATKIATILLKSVKEYIGVMRLHQKQSEETIRTVSREFLGTIYQRPPLRSSVKRRLRTRRIYYLDHLEIDGQNVLFRVASQAGTYIRKLVHDIGEALGPGAHMAELRRTRTGPFREDESLATLQDITDAYHFWKEDGEETLLRQYLRPLEVGVAHLPQIVIRDTAVAALAHGANLAVAGVLKLHADIEKGDLVGLMTMKGELVAIATALQSSNKILKAQSGIIADVNRVIIPADTYPPAWRRKK